MYHQGADLSIGINVEDYITTNDPRIRAFDGHSLQDLEENYNNIVGGNGPGAGTGPGSIPWNLKPEFDQYLEDRRNLYNLHGIGNGPEGILEGTVIEFIRECNWVWVWCWQDPADYGSILAGGDDSSSSSGSYLPAWQDNYNDLRFCEGVGDVHDTGQDNPNGIHPNFDFCSTWMDYLTDCILPSQSETDTYEETIWQWAQFQYTNPDLFDQTIADPNDCTPTDQIDLNGSTDEECINALDAFQTAIAKTLNKFEKWAILNPTDQTSMPCADQAAFNVWALNELLEYNYNISLPQSIQDEALNTSDFTSTLAYKVFSFLEDHPNESFDISFVEELVLFQEEEGILYIMDEDETREYGLEFSDPDSEIYEAPPSTSGWLSCTSFDYSSPDGFSDLMTAGVDDLLFVWQINGNQRIVGPFDIDCRVNRFNNGTVLFEDDVAYASSWAANRAGKILSFLVLETPMSDQTIVKTFVFLMQQGLNNKRLWWSSKFDNIKSSILWGNTLNNRKVSIYHQNMAQYILTCGPW